MTTEVPEATHYDVERVLESLGGIGTYTASDLYDAYVQRAQELGRAAVGRRGFGMALRLFGAIPKGAYINGRTCRVWRFNRLTAWNGPASPPQEPANPALSSGDPWASPDEMGWTR